MTSGRAAPAELESEVMGWVAEDPDPLDRSELESLLAESRTSASARTELADRFADRLHFGTAGLRGAVGAGPNRMNRAVVRSTTAALCKWLEANRPEARSDGVVVGCDARHRSSDFADEATAVLAGAGIKVHRLADRRPTPLLAFAVRHLGAAAGVMITASHNPPEDNGYKLYLGDGAQIVPPVDLGIEELIGDVGPLSRVELGSPDGPLVSRLGDEVEAAYLDALPQWGAAVTTGFRVVYTPMHGVAGPLVGRALEAAGYPPPSIVSEQENPDPDFPTVAFPNPEEPGAMNLAYELARNVGADLVIANDPDGDRMAVAVPDAGQTGGWRRMSGDEVGVLLGDFVISKTTGEDRLVAASIVSSSMLEKVAATAGVQFVATLTGFKWIVRAPLSAPGRRFVFGYEEALGYAVSDTVRDKDGISAALAFLALVTRLRQEGRTVLDRLDDLYARHGVHQTSQLSLRTDEPQVIMRRLRADPPAEVAGRPVTEALDLSGGVPWRPGLPPLPPADVLVFRFDAARAIVRPSGTEPKLKAYLETVLPVGREGVEVARRTCRASLEEMETALAGMIGGEQ